jgi:preprotein translocase subunit SecG
MITVVLVIHVMLAVSLIGIVLIQKSEGGGLGVGGGGGMSGFMTGRSQANLLTRTTAILAAGFLMTSITLAIMHARTHGVSPSLLDQAGPTTLPTPASTAPATPAPAGTAPNSTESAPSQTPAAAPAPAAPSQPSVPLAK